MRKDLSKDHPRNRLMDYYIPGAAVYSRIVKVEHFPSDAPSSSNTRDLEPFVMYSMNKHRRWEIDPSEIDSSEDVKVVVLEREITSCYSTWMCLNNHNFNEAYNCSRVVDASCLDTAKRENKVVGYHIIRVPRHFKKIFDKKCFRYIGLRYPEFLGYSSKDLRPIDYELLEYVKEQEDVDENNEDESFETSVEEFRKPRLFYNLEEHIVFRKSKTNE